MAWGKSKPPVTAPSTLSQVLPLLIAFAVLAGIGWILYQFYVSLGKIQAQASKRMGDKNMTFTKEGGLRVGVKQVAEEEYVGKTRSVFVKAWNLGTGADADGERPPSTPGSNRKNR